MSSPHVHLQLLILLVAGCGSLSDGENDDYIGGGGGRHCAFSPDSRSLNCSLPGLESLISGGGRGAATFLDAFPAAAAARNIRIRCDEGWREWEDEGGGGWGEEGLGGRLLEDDEGLASRPFSGLGGLERLEIEQCRQVHQCNENENSLLLKIDFRKLLLSFQCVKVDQICPSVANPDAFWRLSSHVRIRDAITVNTCSVFKLFFSKPVNFHPSNVFFQ